MATDRTDLLMWYEARVPSKRPSRNMWIRSGPLLDTDDDFVIAANEFLWECRELLNKGEHIFRKGIIVSLDVLRTAGERPPSMGVT
jgi:hypothetical protein